MRTIIPWAASGILLAGILAVIAFAGVTGQEKPENPEEEFFGESWFLEGAPENPTSEIGMMPPGMAGMDPWGQPMRPPPGGTTCGVDRGPGTVPQGMGCLCGGMRSGGFGMPEPFGGKMWGMMHGGPQDWFWQRGWMMKGGGPEPKRMDWEHQLIVFHLLTYPLHHAEELGLTGAEKKAIEALREKLLYPTIEKEKALEAARFALADTLRQPDFDPGKAREYANKIGALESEIGVLTVQAATEVRKILGPERYGTVVRGEGHHRPSMPGMMQRHRRWGMREERLGAPPDRGQPHEPPRGSGPSD